MRITTISLTLLLLAAVVSPAAIYRSGNTVRVEMSDALEENVVLTGQSVYIDSEVNGDVLSGSRSFTQRGPVRHNLYAAAQTVDLLAPVGGDMLVFAQNITVRADTTGDLRGACQTLSLFGRVEGDVMVLAQTVYIGPEAVITGDLYFAAEQVELMGRVDGDMKGGVEQLTLQGTVRGNAELWVDDVDVLGAGRIEGNLVYHAEEERDLPWASKVHGDIVYRPLEAHEKGDDGGIGGFFAGLLVVLSAIVSALLLILVWRNGAAGAAHVLDNRLGASILIGLLAVAAVPLIAVLALVLLVTMPAGIILLLLYPVMLYLGWLVFGIWLGKLVLDGLRREESSLWLAGPLGVALLAVLGFVPWVGWVISLAAIIAGSGMLLIQLHSMKDARYW